MYAVESLSAKKVIFHVLPSDIGQNTSGEWMLLWISPFGPENFQYWRRVYWSSICGHLNIWGDLLFPINSKLNHHYGCAANIFRIVCTHQWVHSEIFKNLSNGLRESLNIFCCCFEKQRWTCLCGYKQEGKKVWLWSQGMVRSWICWIPSASLFHCQIPSANNAGLHICRGCVAMNERFIPPFFLIVLVGQDYIAILLLSLHSLVLSYLLTASAFFISLWGDYKVFWCWEHYFSCVHRVSYNRTLISAGGY